MTTQPRALNHRIRRSIRDLLRHFVVLAAGLMLVAVPSLAVAGDHHDHEDPFDRSGLYVGISGVYQHNVFEDRIEDLLEDALQEAVAPTSASLGVSLEASGGLNAVVGYRLASFFAAELQYEWVSKYDVKASLAGDPPVPSASGSLYSIGGSTLTANTKFIVPFWRVQPYLLLGVGFSTWNVDRGPLADPLELLDPEIDIDGGRQTGLAGRAGVGLDLYITPSIVLNAQGQIVLTTLKKPDLGDIDDFNYLGFSAGLQYRF
ncbi:MAG: hypothetical protein VX466_04875 [Myxococcota bacterium]|nr:hypothetical protein [Myxococcota bacterium]